MEWLKQRVKKLNKSKYENTIKLYGVIGQYRDKFNGLVNTHNNSYSTDDIESEFSKVYALAELEW
ncbi:MAG: hypothetical protein LBH00_02230 [Planctomycetaceae bacterium]|jgi:hypothetical protein|nr:hypothetical protein [Planctomycetaceae bacterium]